MKNNYKALLTNMELECPRKKIRCAVCGTLIEDVPCEICSICNWEHDNYQEAVPESTAGPNKLSLIKARAEWNKKME